jgi:hypothetical protein
MRIGIVESRRDRQTGIVLFATAQERAQKEGGNSTPAAQSGSQSGNCTTIRPRNDSTRRSVPQPAQLSITVP